MSHVPNAAKAILPAPLRRWLRGLRNPEARLRNMWEHDAALGKVIHQHAAGKVLAGPFVGLHYVDTALGSTIGPKLVGTYELELHLVIEQIVQRPYTTFVDIGTGEGYYVVGLASRMPALRVIGFEVEERNRAQLARLAEMNGVSDRIELHGLCTTDVLRDVLLPATGQSGKVLILCDIEGAELDVLRPDLVPELLKADLLVEMHDVPEQPVSEPIRERFAATHDIQVIWSTKRQSSDWPRNWPASAKITGTMKRDCMAERRDGAMSWFWMKAR